MCNWYVMHIFLLFLCIGVVGVIKNMFNMKLLIIIYATLWYVRTVVREFWYQKSIPVKLYVVKKTESVFRSTFHFFFKACIRYHHGNEVTSDFYLLSRCTFPVVRFRFPEIKKRVARFFFCDRHNKWQKTSNRSDEPGFENQAHGRATLDIL